MKKLMCLLLLLLLLVPGVSAHSPRIVDEADLLTAQEEAALEVESARIAEAYQIDVVILTVDSLGYKDPETFADDYYDSHDYGYGTSYSGVLLVLSMEYRDWTISTTGEGIYALTDYGIQALFSQMADDLAADRYYDGFCAYLSGLESYFEEYANGSPVDGPQYEYNGPGIYYPGTGEGVIHYDRQSLTDRLPGMLLLSLVIGGGVGAIAILVMRSGMNTAKSQSGAGNYVKSGLILRSQVDQYLYSNTHRVRRDNDSGPHHHPGGGGGGSRVHHSSSGRSHGGGHGKF